MDGTSVSGLSVTIKLGLSVLMCGNAMKTATPELMHMEVSKKHRWSFLHYLNKSKRLKLLFIILKYIALRLLEQ